MPDKIHVALIGESPNDTGPMIALLNQRFSNIAEFKTLMTDTHGSYLDRPGFPRTLRAAYLSANPKPDILIAIRDLDGLADDADQLELRKRFFRSLRNAINLSSRSSRRITGKQRGEKEICPLLCIYEFEALILADIEIFNREYRTELEVADPEKIIRPKEVLIEASSKAESRTYQEGHCHDLFPLLRIDIIEQNSTQFRIFLQKLSQSIASVSGDN